MTDRVDNNLFRQNVNTTNTPTNPQPNPGIGDSFLAAGQLLSGAGVQDSMVRAHYNAPGGCFGFGYGGGFGGHFFPVPGLDATDIWARTRLLDNFNGITDIMKGVNNIGNTGTTNGVTDDATAAQKTTNPADAFSKLDFDKIKDAAAKEQEIEKKEKELNDEKAKKDAGDKEKIKTLSKQLYDLRKEYAKLDKELGGGKELSKQFGGKGSFYKNISETEFGQIQDINNEIKTMKEELKKLEEEGSKLAQEYTNTKQKLMNAGKATDEQSVLNAMSEASRTRFTEIKDERETKISEIETKIKELKSFIEKAGNSPIDKDTDFYTHTEEKATEDKKKAGSNIGKAIADKMYNTDGTLKSKDDIKSEIAKLGTTGEYSDTEINAVLNRIYGVAEGKTKDQLREELGKKEFFTDGTGTINDKGVLGISTANGKELKLLQKTYDSIFGSSGKFEENGKKHLSTPQWNGIKQAIDKANKAEETKPAASSGGASNSTGEGAVSDADKRTNAGKAVETARKKLAGLTEKPEPPKTGAPEETPPQESQEVKKAKEELSAAEKKLAFLHEIDAVSTTRLTDIKTKLESKERASELDNITDAELVQLLKNSSYTHDIISACYSSSPNDYSTMRELCHRLNKIFEEYGLQGGIYANDDECPDRTQYYSTNIKEDYDTKRVTNELDIDWFKGRACTDAVWGVAGSYDHVAPALIEAATGIRAKLS